MVSKIYGPHVPKPGKAGQIGSPVHMPQAKTAISGKTEFQRILEEKTGRVQFSNHANKRLEQRGIELSSQDIDRLNQAVNRAGSKGSKESLVLLNGLAFVVSVSNRTVITAIDMESMKENVITNIDSAVLA